MRQYDASIMATYSYFFLSFSGIKFSKAKIVLNQIALLHSMYSFEKSSNLNLMHNLMR